MKTFQAILLAGGILCCCIAVQAQEVDGIKAVVHDSVVTFQEVEIITTPVADVLRRQYRNQPDEYQKKIVQALDENLDQLIERQLILRDFESQGYNLPESLIDEMVQERIRTRYGNRVALTKSLQEQGMTFEKFRQQVREQFIIEALRSKNVSSEIMISPQKIVDYYNAHQDEYKVEDQVKLRMIVLNKTAGPDDAQVRQLAEEIHAKIKEGASFSEMATVNSQGSQAKQGGDWGWVEKSVLRKELADVAFSLKPGELSDVIDTPQACYIMLVEESKPAHVKPLNDIRDDIEKILLTQERARLEKKYVDRLKKKTFIRYF